MWLGETDWTGPGWEAEKNRYETFIGKMLGGRAGSTDAHGASGEVLGVFLHIEETLTLLHYQEFLGGKIPIGRRITLSASEESSLLKAYELAPQLVACFAAMMLAGVRHRLPLQFINLLVSIRLERGAEEIADSDLEALYRQYKADPDGFAAAIRYVNTKSPEQIGRRLAVVSLLLTIAAASVASLFYPISVVAGALLGLGIIGIVLGMMVQKEVIHSYHEAYRQWTHGQHVSAVARYAALILFLTLTWAYQLWRLVFRLGS